MSKKNPVPLMVVDMKSEPDRHWNPRFNTDTDSLGYFIEHAGSLMLGDPNSQNTIEEILDVLKKYEPQGVVLQHIIPNLYEFRGNAVRQSNAFCVWIWRESVARQVRKTMREILGSGFKNGVQNPWFGLPKRACNDKSASND